MIHQFPVERVSTCNLRMDFRYKYDTEQDFIRGKKTKHTAMVTLLRVVSARGGSSVEPFVVLYLRQPCVTKTHARVSLRTFLHICIILTERYGGGEAF